MLLMCSPSVGESHVSDTPSPLGRGGFPPFPLPSWEMGRVRGIDRCRVHHAECIMFWKGREVTRAEGSEERIAGSKARAVCRGELSAVRCELI
jgi:hypothetical protein